MNFGIDIDMLTETSDLEGFVYINNYEDLNKLKEQGLITSVEYYLDDIPSLNNINSNVMDSFRDSNGHVWGFPLTNTNIITYRSYNEDWLSSGGFSIPKDIESFSEYAKYIAKEDPDGNGIMDSYILGYSKYSALQDFADIFRAFGCYVDGADVVVYNPHKGKYENAILNENFINAISFIKWLKDNAFIIDLDNNMGEKIHLASTYGSHNRNSNVVFGFYLEGDNKEFLIKEKYYPICLAVLCKTENIANKTESILKIALSGEGALDLSFGEKDKVYTDQISHYSIDATYSEGFIGIYSNLDENGGRLKPIVENDKTESINAYYNMMQSRKAANELLGQYFGTSKMYYHQEDTATNELRYLNYTASGIALLTINDILENKSLIDEAIYSYRHTAERSGWIQVLEGINLAYR
ncbi:MAG: hypothetical protein JXB33_08945 [Clostridia bacterium]|nr:hypothetical protein [Clostridia bacterium]